jgi:hypothetical protein
MKEKLGSGIGIGQFVYVSIICQNIPASITECMVIVEPKDVTASILDHLAGESNLDSDL